jgi:hypothetical protein
MDADSTVRRVERNAWATCAAMALLALFVRGGGLSLSVAVLAGGTLIALAYWTLKTAVAAVLARAERAPAAGRGAARAVLGVTGRYALLGFLAYVMIARLRLHPLGLLAGASSFVAAVSIETLRLLIRKH